MLRTLSHKAFALGVGFGAALWSVSAQAVPKAVASLVNVDAVTDTFDAKTPNMRLIIFNLGATSEVGRDELGIRSLDDAVASDSDADSDDGDDEGDDDGGLATLADIVPFPVIGILLAGLGLLAARRRARARMRGHSGMAPPS